MLCFCGAVRGSQDTSDHVRWHLRGDPAAATGVKQLVGHYCCWLCLCAAARKLPESQRLMQTLRRVLVACHV